MSALLAIALTLALGSAFAFALRAARLRDALERERSQTAQRIAECEMAAITAERERIYGDLHDDLGAGLLDLVHAAQTPQQADRARALLQDLRDVVTRSRGTPGTLGDVLGDIRAESAQRLAAAGIGLDWRCADDLPDPVLDTHRALHLYRIAREAISNVIRHAQAREMRIRVGVGDGQLRLELTDDGSGAGAEPVSTGRGLDSMRERATALDGGIDWRRGTAGGTKVLLILPLAEYA